MFVYGTIFPKLCVDVLLSAFGGGLAGTIMAGVYLAIRTLRAGRFSRRAARKAVVQWGVRGACLAAGLAAVLIGFSMALRILS